MEMTVGPHPPPRFSSLAESPSLWNASIPKHLEMFPWVWKLLTKNYSRKATVSRTMGIFHWNYCQNVRLRKTSTMLGLLTMAFRMNKTDEDPAEMMADLHIWSKYL